MDVNNIWIYLILSVLYTSCLKLCHGYSCSQQPCQHGGACLQGTSGSYQCLCTDNYKGDNCETYIEPTPGFSYSCNQQPCQHGGVCLQGTGGSYQCLCTDNYEGDTCEIYNEPSNPCDEQPCLNGGVCFPGQDNGYACFCADSYSGTNCDIYDGPSEANSNTSRTPSVTVTQEPSDNMTSATENQALNHLNRTTLKSTESLTQKLKTTQKTENKPTEATNLHSGVSLALFKRWEFLVALLCLEVFAYCGTLCIIFGMQNKRARGKRFGTFKWKGRKGTDRPNTVIA